MLLGALALVSVPVAQAAPAAPMAPRSTPALLDDAVARGQISRSTADEHLVEVFAGRGRSDKVPARFQSDAPWDGTMPLVRLQRRLSAQPASPTKARMEAALAAATSCSDSDGSMPNETTSAHFYVAYAAIGGGLSITSYLTSLEATWTKEVTTFGWAAPPPLATPPPAPIGTRYPVRVDALGGGLYGFVSTLGTGAGFRGNNPNTAWDDLDAYASCMVLNTDYGPFPGTSQQALDATVAHEFNHAIQFGYGAIDGANVPDDLFFEGGATWMEDEVFDAANDSYGYLWPDFGESLGDYDSPSPYATWIFLRGLTERFGTGSSGGGEEVMQGFWEATSKNAGNNLSALAAGLATKGVTLPDAYHDFAIAAGFLRPCGGGYALPHCFEEAAGYVAAAGTPPVDGSIPAVGGSFSGTVEDDYALAWVTLPASATYSLTLTNTSAGGQLRATAVCDTGTTLVRSPLPTVVGAGASARLPRFRSTGCVRTLAVITNQQQSPGNPSSSASRSFTLGTGTVRQAAVADFDGNGTTDRSLYRDGAWHVQGQPTAFLGLPGYQPVPADYDGNGDTERAVFLGGAWFVEGQPPAFYGLPGDVPVPGDYDGDGDADRAVYRPLVGGWYVEGQAPVYLGLANDIPVPGDYDGDGDTDRAVYRTSGAWYVHGQAPVYYGLPGYVPVPGDYDGNGTTERAVFKDGAWYVQNQPTVFLGLAGHVPQPGDYDGDGDTDRAVFDGNGWYVQGQATVFFGLAGDTPLPLPTGILSRLLSLL